MNWRSTGARVARQRVVVRVVLVEIALVVGGVDERLAGRMLAAIRAA
jgi:hypothetical protein